MQTYAQGPEMLLCHTSLKVVHRTFLYNTPLDLRHNCYCEPLLNRGTVFFTTLMLSQWLNACRSLVRIYFFPESGAYSRTGAEVCCHSHSYAQPNCPYG